MSSNREIVIDEDPSLRNLNIMDKRNLMNARIAEFISQELLLVNFVSRYDSDENTAFSYWATLDLTGTIIPMQHWFRKLLDEIDFTDSFMRVTRTFDNQTKICARLKRKENDLKKRHLVVITVSGDGYPIDYEKFEYAAISQREERFDFWSDKDG